ncbi:hypothetical protein I5G61_gp51 [Mycobacterium phage Quesadilla]|uniref:SsDNA binding protein n=1 Tax=Mycobacterium phage Quesadilla TaxID=2664226 RepID=A0A5Q2WF34_9CAUD|nr:hypothetical protein I5G61_gp51 [Mycobacterium phage Quesadilla]QGH75299.1 hypothetical protein SEA_QUESADILLA_51 [Mycobacterium phage Quesadilla]
MAGSPFNKGGAATATKPAASKRDALPDEVTNAGSEDGAPAQTVKAKGDPFGNVGDPTGVSGYKPGSFMGQLVLMHATETGWMKTSSNTPENPQSEYVRFDIIPLTVPEEGAPTRNPATKDAEGNVTVLNKDGDVETFEAYEVGERIDDVLIFNKPLVREGKKALDNGTAWVLGRITLGQKKQGQSPPVILVAADEEDKSLFQEWRKAQG